MLTLMFCCRLASGVLYSAKATEVRGNSLITEGATNSILCLDMFENENKLWKTNGLYLSGPEQKSRTT